LALPRISSFVYCRRSLGDELIIKETKIARSGICHQCGSALEHQPRISDEEFAELRQEFMNKSLTRKGNIFLQSTPEELSEFHQFLEKHQSCPFTVVFDGLNISGCTGQLNSTNARSQLVGEFCTII